MKKILLLNLLFIFFFSCQDNNQKRVEVNPKTESTKTDSVKKFSLSGTTILPWTVNQQIAKSYGIHLESVKITECDNDSEPTGTNKIDDIIETDETLIIETKIQGNCCHDFLCDIEVINEDTINLIYFGYGESYCSCTCCFGITYKFSIMRIESYKKIKKIMINNEEYTIKEK